MVGLRLYPMYETDHLNTGTVHQKTRWLPFVRYSNGWAFRYSNGIWKPDHLASNLFATICLVFRSPLYSWTWLTPVPGKYVVCYSDSPGLQWIVIQFQIFNFFRIFWSDLPLASWIYSVTSISPWKGKDRWFIYKIIWITGSESHPRLCNEECKNYVSQNMPTSVQLGSEYVKLCNILYIQSHFGYRTRPVTEWPKVVR